MFTFILGIVIGIVVGALFARRNASKVETAVTAANNVKSVVEKKIKK